MCISVFCFQLVILCELVDKMEKNIQNALDIQVPLKKKQLPIRTRVPWYTNDLKQQKQTVRKREQIWRKYRAEHQWIALKEERKKIHYHGKKSKDTYAVITGYRSRARIPKKTV